MITRLLVANRAEIASRVFRTCRELGIETVAVHSEADAGLPYVSEADFAVPLTGSSPSETYLRADLLVEAARRARADAVHPGYGFLSESADFARAVQDAGLRWIGPEPASVEQMGSKVAAKKLMEAAGVPVLADLDPATVTEADLPVLVKASAGGGGRGMRVVRRLQDLGVEVAAAQAEAASAFGDGTVFVETYVERGRHVEVQVVGDTHGRVEVYGERDCSVQRRHQKVVEETPAPRLPDATRVALHEAARAAAQAVDYVGAGTVEFLYDQARAAFWFLEMNTRLQVEHPVTEEVHGVDLVALQLAVAEGSALDPAPPPRGHAVEARLYAEDPSQDYQPDSGVLTRFELPTGEGIRVDAGFAGGSEVSTHYDAMLAKVVAWAPTRELALRRLVGALRTTRVHGLRTNRDQLVSVLTSPDLLAGDVSTALLADPAHSERAHVDRGAALLAATTAVVLDLAARRGVQRGIPAGWRNVVSQAQRVELLVPGEPGPTGITWMPGRDAPLFPDADFQVTRTRPAADGHRIDFVWQSLGSWAEVVLGPGVPGTRTIHVDGPLGSLTLVEVPRFTDPADAVAAGSLLAPMPGTVVAVPVTDGATVAAGDPVVVLEAMKMQHTIKAPADGEVGDLVAVGTQVAAGDVLAVVTPTEE